jgi:hypothetical protein
MCVPNGLRLQAFDTSIDVSILGQLALGHCSNDSGGNVVMLAGGRRNESGQRKVPQELD